MSSVVERSLHFGRDDRVRSLHFGRDDRVRSLHALRFGRDDKGGSSYVLLM